MAKKALTLLLVLALLLAIPIWAGCGSSDTSEPTDEGTAQPEEEGAGEPEDEGATQPDEQDTGTQDTDSEDEDTTDTTPPAICDISATDITEASATITWTTDELATSQVEYGLTDSYGSSSSKNNTLVTTHSVALSGLAASTTYHYRVNSSDDSSNDAISNDYTLTTPDTTPPVISTVSATTVTADSATITWSTDEPATSNVEYGTGGVHQSQDDPDLVIDHSVALTGLSSETEYYYWVESTDDSDNSAESITYEFTTAAELLAVVEITSHSSYMGILDNYNVVGELQNNGSANLEFVKITATFYDSSGAVVGMDFTYADIDILVPGQKSPFWLFLWDETVSAAVDHYALVISDYDATQTEPYGEFEILSHTSSIGSLGWYNVVGEVENTGTQSEEFVMVVGTFYDSAGTVVATDFTYTSPNTLAPGQVAPFELFVLEDDQVAMINSYELQVQCSDW